MRSIVHGLIELHIEFSRESQNCSTFRQKAQRILRQKLLTSAEASALDALKLSNLEPV